MAELPSTERPAWIRDDLGDATGRGVRVAVIDSGRDPEWDEPRVRPGLGLVDPERQFDLLGSGDDRDRIGHGTACCDLLLRLAPEVEIVPVRVFGDLLETSPKLITTALEWAASESFDIVNLSLGTLLESALEPLYRASQLAHEQGVLIVSAVHLERDWSYPAVFEHVLSVQAGRFGNVYDYEYHQGAAVEIHAQGGCEVRWLGGKRRQIYGSSFAAPHVSAIVALFRERFPTADLDEIRGLLARYGVAEPGTIDGDP